MKSVSISKKALDSRARRAAHAAGYTARKSRRTYGDNEGAYMLVDPMTGFPVAGFRHDMSAEEVVEWCKDD